MFITRILQVDAEAGRLVIGYSSSKAANSTLLAARTVVLHVEFSRSHVVLRASSPVNAAFEKQPGIRLDPGTILKDWTTSRNPGLRRRAQSGRKARHHGRQFHPVENDADQTRKRARKHAEVHRQKTADRDHDEQREQRNDCKLNSVFPAPRVPAP